MTTFLPTHSIKLTTLAGAVSTLEVSMEETTGPAYTKVEWEAGASACWEVDGDGVWTFHGQVAPSGVETVEVRPIVATQPRGGSETLYCLEIDRPTRGWEAIRAEAPRPPTVYALDTEGEALSVTAGTAYRDELARAFAAPHVADYYHQDAAGQWVRRDLGYDARLVEAGEVPVPILARAALAAVVEVLPPGPEAEAFSAWVAAGCPVPAVTYRLGGLEAYNRGAALVRAPDAASYAAGAAYQRWAEEVELAADAAWAATWQAREAASSAAREAEGHDDGTSAAKWRKGAARAVVRAGEAVASARAARAELVV